MGNKPVLASRVLLRRDGFLVGVWVAYLLSFFLLYRWMGSFATILAVVPVIVSSWLLGFWAGVLAGLTAFLLDMFLLYVVRSPELQVMLGVPGVPIAMVMLTPPEILPHIFEPFTTTHPDKTALGLSISYTIIEAHGGQMTVASQMGVGTTFTLLLPVKMANVE